MTPQGQPLRNQRPLDRLDNRDPLDNRDTRNKWNPGLLTELFALPPSIVLLWPILLLMPIPFPGSPLQSLEVLQFVILRFALFRFTLLPWHPPWPDCLVEGCRVWMITTHQQNGWHKVGQSGTTVQFMSPTVSDTGMMMNILSGFWFSGAHRPLFGVRSCRI